MITIQHVCFLFLGLLPALTSFAEKKTDISTIVFETGVAKGTGDLLQSDPFPYFSLGLRSQGVGPSDSLRYMNKVYIASSKTLSGKSQSSFVPDSYLYVSDLGYKTGLCYQSFVNVCPELTLESKGLANLGNAFHFLASGFGLELEKSFEGGQFILGYHHTYFNQRIAGKNDTGGMETLTLGGGLFL